MLVLWTTDTADGQAKSAGGFRGTTAALQIYYERLYAQDIAFSPMGRRCARTAEEDIIAC
jgi:hypothetical protein